MRKPNPPRPESELPDRSAARQPELRILICDDHALFREGLCALLERLPGWQVVGQAKEGGEALALVARLTPDVVVMDVAMPGMSGIDATAAIRHSSPGTEVVALSMDGDEHHRRRMTDAGAKGYILKDDASTELVAAIGAVRRGESFVSPTIVERRAPLASTGDAGTLDALSPREMEVFRLLALGHRPRVVAEMLGIGIKTAESHRASILLKLRAENLAELVKIAIRCGVIGLD